MLRSARFFLRTWLKDSGLARCRDMATRYVEVSSQAIENLLSSKGFVRTVQNREVVYVFTHKADPCVKVKVYTSLRDGASVARGCGEDAIRICTVFEGNGKSFGIGKFPKILRTGSEEAVLDRIIERARIAYLRGTEFVKESRARFANRAS